MIGVSFIYVILSLLLIVVGLINRDMVPGGTDYLFYMLIGILSVKTMIGNRKFSRYLSQSFFSIRSYLLIRLD